MALGSKNLLSLKHGALMGDDTDSHIDTLARFIDKTIAYVKCYDKKDIHFLNSEDGKRVKKVKF